MSCTLPSLPSSVPSFCVDGFFVIVIVNVVGSRTITAIETDDVVGTNAYRGVGGYRESTMGE